MKEFFFSKRHTISQYAVIIVFPLCALLVFGSGLYVLISEPITQDSWVIFSLSLLIGFAILLIGLVLYIITYRYYQIDADGVYVQYAKKWTVFYPWEKVEQVCVCKLIRSTTTKDSYNEVIWLVLGPVRYAPPDLHHRYDISGYATLNWKKILIIEYSLERLEELKKYYLSEIKDYR